MIADALVALIDSRIAGHVQRDRRGRLRFDYEPSWRQNPQAVPLSLSMPLAARTHGHRAIEPFLWGLLPDNPFVLDRWGRRFQVSPRNPFALLGHVGEDCAGAVQFVRPERLDRIEGPGPEDVLWLNEGEVAGRLRALRRDHGAARTAADSGQFSLAGAQAKTAFLVRDGRYGVPAGRTPTTHILKPPLRDLEGHVENEHLCLSLARALGLPTARSAIRRFHDEIAIEIARFDRVTDGANSVRRIHQEDLCQALGVHPARKYENEGGPSPNAIVDMLREFSTQRESDVGTFVDALAFNWLIAGTDAHAKNYAVLHASGGVRLAPLYDMATALPYSGFDAPKLKLAMRIGGRYRLQDIARPQWERLANELALDPVSLIDRMIEMAGRLPEEALAISRQMGGEGADQRQGERISTLLADRAIDCVRTLTAS